MSPGEEHMWKPALIVLLLLVCTVAIVQAQSEECPAIVEQALQPVSEICNPLDRNSACYGADNVESTTFVEPRPADFFLAPGDRSALAQLREIHPQPIDTASGKFGVALLNLQANIPNTLPGQAVLFLLMGDARLTNEVPQDSADQSPFQSFYFLPKGGNSGCYEADPMLTIQTPGNITVTMMFNGVETEMSPGTLLTITPSVCTIHRGNIIQRVGADTAVLLANQTVDISISEAGAITVNGLRGISEREYQRGQQIQTTINALAKANGWVEQFITQPRQFDQEPVATQPAPEATEAPVATASTCQTQHVIRAGETLNRIARQYNTTIQAIAQANNISNTNLIYPGQTLCIPG